MTPSRVVPAVVLLVLAFAAAGSANSLTVSPGFGVGNIIKTFVVPGKIATGDLFGDHFSCVASNVSDADTVQVSVTIFDDSGAAMPSFPAGQQSCSALGPHQSCSVVYIPYPLQMQAHCEISVAGGDPGDLRGVLTSYSFNGDTISQVVTTAR